MFPGAFASFEKGEEWKGCRGAQSATCPLFRYLEISGPQETFSFPVNTPYSLSPGLWARAALPLSSLCSGHGTDCRQRLESQTCHDLFGPEKHFEMC